MTAHGKRGRGRSRKRRAAASTIASGPSSGGPSGASSGGQSQAEPDTKASTSARAARSPKATRSSSDGARAQGASARRRGARRAPRARGGGLADMVPAGKRPDAPWHPLPLSELLILVGAIGAIVGLSRGISHGGAPLIAGLVAVAIGTIEVTLREHLSGYRSHAIMLAMLPLIALDSALVLLVQPFGTPLRLGMLAFDVALFVALYRILRARFAEARRERSFSGGR